MTGRNLTLYSSSVEVAVGPRQPLDQQTTDAPHEHSLVERDRLTGLSSDKFGAPAQGRHAMTREVISSTRGCVVWSVQPLAASF